MRSAATVRRHFRWRRAVLAAAAALAVPVLLGGAAFAALRDHAKRRLGPLPASQFPSVLRTHAREKIRKPERWQA